ncbi:MAG: hypothetical protein D6806_15985 [Deltaproteobacteria bacterium]|nr:MAG: hypothetical protein D6806_15985 [Deltaproteobacteria bacterium]
MASGKTICGIMAVAVALAACGGGKIEKQPVTKDQVRAMGKADWSFDYCDYYGWYGDGICDDFCPAPDPDCRSGSCRSSADCLEGEYCRAGTCVADGTCETADDCALAGNDWAHPRCVGNAVCEEGTCGWVCGQQDTGGSWSWTYFLLGGIESEHPYANNTERQWVIEQPGASKIKIHFSKIDIEQGYDWLLVESDDGTQQVFDGSAEDVWTREFPGSKIVLTLRSDYSVTGYGFKADQIAIYEQLPAGQCNRDADCSEGQRCEPHQCINPYAPCHGDCVPAESPRCIVTGCSGQICGTEHVTTTCEWRPEYGCLQHAICEVQPDGSCGWTHTPEYEQCMNDLAEPDSWTYASDDTPIDIPDADPAGIQSTVYVPEVPRCGNLAKTLSLHVAHSYVGDLVIELRNEQGDVHTVWSREGGSSDRIDLEGLELPAGYYAGGTLTLQVRDLAALDTGTLESWSITLSCK